jgi:predicted transcriptional regulator
LADALDNRLYDLRTRKGLTQGELAERVGVSRKTINTVENSRAHSRRAWKRSSSFATDADDLVGLCITNRIAVQYTSNTHAGMQR